MDAEGVLDFLRRGGFRHAAEAFLEDVIARGGFAALDFHSDGEEEIVVEMPPPLRTGSDRRVRSRRTSSGDDDAFVSIGSSLSGLIDHQEVHHAENVEWISPDAPSEFCIAQGQNGADKSSDVNFCGEFDFGGCRKDPYLMFSDTSDVGRQNGAQIGCLEWQKGGVGVGCEDCFKVNGNVLPHHDPGSVRKGYSNGDPLEMGSNSSWSVSKNRVVRESMSSFKSVEEVPGSDYWEADLQGCSDDILCNVAENLDLKLFDNELHMLRIGQRGEEGLGKFNTNSVLNFDRHERKKQTKDSIVSSDVENGFHGDDDAYVSDQSYHEDVNGDLELNEDRDLTIGIDDLGLHLDLKDEHDTSADFQMLDGQEDEFEIFELRVVHRKNRTGFEENRDMPIILNSLIAGRYYATEFLGSAAFSKVVQAHDLHTGADVCLKIIKNDKDFFDQSLDEIKLLKFVNKHDPADECHVLRLYDYFYHQEHLFIVCELLKANLYEFQKYNQESDGELYFTMPRIQAIARQCLEALQYLHHLGIIHCDLKPENILIKSYSRCEIKIIDLGSSCFHSDNLSLYVQSRSYRAPDVILGLPYDQKIDIWSLGCVLAELFSGNVLFPNESLEVLLSRVSDILGPFDREMLDMGQETHKYFTKEYVIYSKIEETGNVEYIIPKRTSLAQHLGYPDQEFVSFLEYLLQTNPQRRPTAAEALEHPWLSFPYS